MITLEGSTYNNFLVYKCFLVDYDESTVFTIVQGDVTTVADVSVLIDYPNSTQFALHTDLTGFYGNDFTLVATKGDSVIYEEKLTIT